MHRLTVVIAAVFAVASLAGAQDFQRRARMVGGGGDRGKCTIEVVVDGAAEVEIRGDMGNIRNLSGNPAQWRRFECNAPMPRNPVNFRFQGIDGRGRQDLIQDPRQSGAAVVRIEDNKGGSEGYTFDLMWGGGDDRGPGGFPGGGPRGPGGYPGGDRPGQRFTTEQAIRTCQDAVRREAGDRYGRIEFLDTRIDDNPGRNDWVIGMIDIQRGPGRDRVRFSCSVNFDTGQVRSVKLDDVPDRRGGPDRGSRFTKEQAVRICEESVRQQAGDRFRGRRVEFLNINIDDNPGRNDWVVGTIEVFRGRNFSEGRHRFSCSVNFDTGRVRSVDIDSRRN